MEMLAGQDGVAGFADGNKTEAAMRRPSGLCVDPTGYCYVADTGNAVVRRVSTSGMVVTVEGGDLEQPDDAADVGTTFLRQPRGISADDSHLYVAGMSPP